MATTPYSPTVAASARTAGTDRFVRFAFLLDAAVTGANGIGYLALAGVLDSFLGFSTAVQYPVGAFLAVYAVGVLVVATRKTVGRAAGLTVVALNAIWALGSLVVAAEDTLGATSVGTVWTVLQGLVVGGFAILQYVGLRRS
ncbi:hypothetical protein [Streptomyces huiliensis]|uniref:hypothetical protein n=1 Tax=Streptomyces huiliensis TaxID=2876027 RepID=UPI001CBB35F1|nr:hypothetical protein [Streptomyces huiliensis]MBZ4322508.1 hypothetical protein [Streptomyces huiliensis]